MNSDSNNELSHLNLRLNGAGASLIKLDEEVVFMILRKKWNSAIQWLAFIYILHETFVPTSHSTNSISTTKANHCSLGKQLALLSTSQQNVWQNAMFHIVTSGGTYGYRPTFSS